jgi:peptidoglycan/xylan/chitin deacetylase (PgdA/CDA1 family)
MAFTLPGNASSGNYFKYVQLCFFSLALNIVMFFPASALNNNHKSPSSNFEYQIADWHGFKKAAFTVTFDDNYRFQVTLATPILNEHNYKATYFIVTNRVGKGWAPGWDTLRMLASEGHEIASHSKNHADFTVLTQHPEWADSMAHEFRDSRDSINAEIPSQRCETFAWPTGAVNATATLLSSYYYMACRGTVNKFNGLEPMDFYNIYSQHIYHNTPVSVVNGFTDTILAKGGWLVERWHGFQLNDDTNGYEPVPIQVFADHISHVAYIEDSLWISTLDSVFKYIRERATATLTLHDTTKTWARFSLTDDLPDSMFHFKVPLTVKIRMFNSMTNVYRITQGKNTLPFDISDVNGSRYLTFDAVPNDSYIIFHMRDPSGVDDIPQEALQAGNYPNPFTGVTTIFFDLPEAGNTYIQVYDKLGREIGNYSKPYPAGRNYLEFDGSSLDPGIYYCIIRSRFTTRTVRMMILQ